MVRVADLAHKAVRTSTSKADFAFVLPHTLMGVEVEVDSDTNNVSGHPHMETVSYWNMHHDGSLLNGYEYTLRMPMAGDMLATAINQLFAAPSDFKRTFTGSTHIHIDMLEEEVTLDVLRTLVLMVYTLEPVLYNAGDSSREWCGYANSLRSADPTLLSTLFSAEVAGRFLNTYRRGGNLGRYYGLNMAALTDYGSLEFRYFPTATSPEELVYWINLVQSFKRAALAIGSPEMLANIFNQELAYNNMIDTYFAPYAELFRSSLEWRRVQSMFSKAGVVSKDHELAPMSNFSARNAFAGDRFASLVAVPDLADYTNVTGTTIHDDGIIPNDPQEHVWLVYSQHLYYRAHGAWISVAQGHRYDNVELPVDALASLSYIVTGEYNLDSRSIAAARWALDNGRIPGNPHHWNEEEDFSSSEDYSDDEEYDEF